MLDCYKKLSSFADASTGSIVRRQNSKKDQQGRLVKFTDQNDGWVLAEVVDLDAGTFLAEGGIVRPEEGDRLWYSQELFQNDEDSKKALEILSSWVLYKKNPGLQSEIRQFVQASYLPRQIIDWKKNDDLPLLFVPIQMRFKIGKYEEKVDYDQIRTERFRKQLAELTDGKHMTYVAFIPRDTIHEPMFFSIGTKPHLETKKVLGEQSFSFHPNHGGHIKCNVDAEENSIILVDAGSNDLGGGIHASLAEAEMIATALKTLYPEFKYKPLAGRGAFGLLQSY